MSKTIAERLEGAGELYEEKDSDYGQAWRLGGEFVVAMMKVAGVEEIRVPADPDVWNSIFMWGRRFDKDSRAFNAEFFAESMNFEATEDSHEDEGVYAFMHADLLRERAAGTDKTREKSPAAALCEYREKMEPRLFNKEEERDE